MNLFCLNSADLNNSEHLRKILRRLPFHVRAKWVDNADFLIEHDTEPDFSYLSRFIENSARVANLVY